MTVKPAVLSERELDALAEAQDLVFDAWDASSPAETLALARKALELSPHCADAWSILAGAAPLNSDERLSLRLRAVEAGRTALGADFDELAGQFWGFVETRPYMRALQWLAADRRERGETGEAISIYRSMIDQNPGDNQGVRYCLVALLAETGAHAELATLVKQYPDEDGAMWLWPLALACFGRTGDGEESVAALREAMSANAHVPAFLTGRKKLPKTQPGFYSPGEFSEAVLYVADFGSGWRKVTGALDWLETRTGPGEKPGRKRKPPTLN